MKSAYTRAASDDAIRTGLTIRTTSLNYIVVVLARLSNSRILGTYIIGISALEF